MIGHEELIHLLCEMIATPSFSREEGAVADLIGQRLAGWGCDVRRCGNNLWMENEPAGDKPTLLLNAHIDTVRPASGYSRDPFTPVLEDGRLYGLGSNDDGGCVIALLDTFQRLSARPQPYRLVWSATAEEEVCGENGVGAAIPEIGPVRLGIIGEPTQMRLAVAERGLMVLDCTAHGRSGHAARDEGDNALYHALDDIAWLRSYRFDRVSDYLGPVKMSVTMISAGTQHNVVPDSCRFVVDVRPNGLYTNREIFETIAAHLGSEVVPRSLRHNSSQIDPAHPVVRRAVSLGLETFGSPTTSNQTVLDFDTVKIGPGDSARSHTADEYICPDEIWQGSDIYCKLLDALSI
ncbi:MAG: M20 family metallo-hydrolase [Bacteroidales bacterium]|nr:M20 family metallo-hydrolase [Bacteroidales bacterium]